ncbi:HSF5 protein, partial [Semnornis frantzii]|nr:HSF5 protein [Semnornis frantzii]
PVSINSEAFPAKLWRLVNSSQFRSVRWDARGQGLIIDEQQFVSEVLDEAAKDGSGLFKTKNFSSIIRQLNLYGFQKVSKGLAMASRPLMGSGDGAGGRTTSFLHHFHSPHFCRDRPDLLMHLTNGKKAKRAPSSRPGSPLQHPHSKKMSRNLP